MHIAYVARPARAYRECLVRAAAAITFVERWKWCIRIRATVPRSIRFEAPHLNLTSSQAMQWMRIPAHHNRLHITINL